MKFALVPLTLISIIISFGILSDSRNLAPEENLTGFSFPPTSKTEACSCGDVSSLTARRRGIEAVLTTLAAETRRTGASGVFDAAAFDNGLGERITETLLTSGGMSSVVIADIDRYSCEINTGASLANIPGVPAGLGGSACLAEAASAGLNVRRQACLTGRNASNQGNDYWEGRRTADVLRELTEAYTAEANLISDRLTSLAPRCRTASRRPVKDLCENCIHYMFDGKRSLPFVGTIRMWADEMIPFDIKPDRTISGSGTINTILDTSGSPCTFTGYNGVANFNIGGNISRGNLNVTLTPEGTSQRSSAAMSITCPPKAEAHTYPQSQTYTISEQLKVPMAGQQFTEKRLDVAVLTRGAMEGEIILRLSMKPIR